MDPAAEKIWLEASREYWQNPSSPYRAGARVHCLLEEKREQLAGWLECDPSLIVFNSGATEGNNGLLQYFKNIAGEEARVAVSAVEHPCVFDTARKLFGERCERLPVTPAGVLDFETVESLLGNQKWALVSVMAANNETGVIQPWEQVAEVCRKRGIALHVDAAQWFGKEPIGDLGRCDFVTGSAHKFGGPKGVGFLKISEQYTGFHGALGGAQENDHRAGTENYPAIAAMVAALEARLGTLEAERERLKKARDAFEGRLLKSIPGVRVLGDGVERLCNTSMLIMPKFENTRWVAQLDKMKFVVSTGSACATGKEGPSHVLAAMQVSADDAKRALRISGGGATVQEDWMALAEAFEEVWKRLQNEGSRSQVIEID